MSFSNVTHVKSSRKARCCYWCPEGIEIGQPKVVIAAVYEGNFFCVGFHPECHKALQRWQSENPGEEMWPDEGSMVRGSSTDPAD